jgi:hypothetical protein
MNRKICMCSVLSAAFFVSAGALQAQDALQGPPPMVVFQGMGPEGGPNVMFGEKIELLGFEGLPGGKVVTGAPFSATISTETTQSLQDGTTIHRTSQGAIYRDSQGRTRREMTMTGFGPLAASGQPHTMVSISDPVAGTHMMLDTTNKVVHKMSVRGPNGGPETARVQSFEQKIQTRRQEEEASGELKNESLGTQTINGVSAQGTRVTHTIPVGQIGNDRAITTVSERWYSPDLQIVVKSTRTDPQFGTTTYAVTNIQRTEPAATLFAAPSDYTVQTGPKGLHVQHRVAGGVDVPPPPPDDQD